MSELLDKSPVSLDDFMDGYLKPTLSSLEKDIVRLRGELQRAERQREELLTTQHVLRSRFRTPALRKGTSNV